MVRFASIGLALSAVLAGAFLLWAWTVTEPTPTTDRLFSDAPDAVQQIARAIERGERPDANQLSSLARSDVGLDARFGQDITLLFHALSAGNVPAIGDLLEAGADVRVEDAPGSYRDFLYYMASPGGELLTAEQLAEVIGAYLAAGGDPNVHLSNSFEAERRTLIEEAVLVRNATAVDVLLEAGADPWLRAFENGRAIESNAIYTAAQSRYEILERFIELGILTDRTQLELDELFLQLGDYAQRGDEISLRIQSISKRILKRNPHYRAPNTGWGTQRIFKDHWNDPGVGEIPWDEIMSDEVR